MLLSEFDTNKLSFITNNKCINIIYDGKNGFIVERDTLVILDNCVEFIGDSDEYAKFEHNFVEKLNEFTGKNGILVKNNMKLNQECGMYTGIITFNCIYYDSNKYLISQKLSIK